MRRWKQLHKWAALLLGIQLFFWVTGGIVMSVIPIEKVRGQHLIKPIAPPNQQTITHVPDIDLRQWQKIEWFWLLDQAVLRLQAFDKRIEWQTIDGHQLPPLTAMQARQLAKERYLGEGKVESAQLLSQAPAEVRHLKGPVFAVFFDDWINTTLYLHPQSGHHLSVRSDLWRLFDFFWMLHILDFDTRSDFNNPLLITMAIASWLFLTTGFALLFYKFIKGPWLRYKHSV